MREACDWVRGTQGRVALGLGSRRLVPHKHKPFTSGATAPRLRTPRHASLSGGVRGKPKEPAGVPTSIQTLGECLLCARHHARCWGGVMSKAPSLPCPPHHPHLLTICLFLACILDQGKGGAQGTSASWNMDWGGAGQPNILDTHHSSPSPVGIQRLQPNRQM